MKKKIGVLLTAVLLIFSSITVTAPCSVEATYHQEVKQSGFIERLGEVFTVDLGDGFSWSYNFTSKTLTFKGNGAFPIRPESCRITEENSGGRYDSTYFLCDRGDVETLVVEDGITDLPDLQGDVRPYYRVDNIIVGKDCKSVPKVWLSYEIDPQNPYFASYDGALYNKELTKLIFLPEKKTSINFPPNLQVIENNAIIYSHVNPLVIPWGVTKIEGENFSDQTYRVIIPDTLINHAGADISSKGGHFSICSENNKEEYFWDYGYTQNFGPAISSANFPASKICSIHFHLDEDSVVVKTEYPCSAAYCAVLSSLSLKHSRHLSPRSGSALRAAHFSSHISWS